MVVFWIATAGVFGLFIGSFLNVLIHRLPRSEDFVQGRSHCPVCGHDLGAADMVPVLSYLLLGRRCRYCRAPISPRYAVVELLTGVIFAVSWWLAEPLSLWAFLGLVAFLSFAEVFLFIRFDRSRISK